MNRPADDRDPAAPAPGRTPPRDVLGTVQSVAGRLWRTVSPAAGGGPPDAVAHLATPGAMSAQQVGAIVRSVRAQREQIRALQTQLTALDGQLGVLEEMLGPLAAVVDTWAAAERAVGGNVLLDRLVGALRAVVPPSGGAGPGPPAST